jgi:5-hydroxyisourate hydrolase-like protein (transthyretin family)
MGHDRRRAWGRHGRLSRVALLLVALVGCSFRQPVASGRVSDAATGAALAGARVLSGDAAAKTDADGAFRLRLQPGTHRLDVSNSGYVTQELMVTLEEGSDGHAQDVALERRRLAAHVVDGESGAPVAGARVTLGESNAVADAQGNLEVEAHISGALGVSCPGYLPLEIPQTEVEATFTPSGALSNWLTVPLTPRVLEGTVTLNDSGAPVPGTTVAVGDASAQADAQGRYRVARVEPGSPIVVQGPSHHPVEGLTYDGQERQDVTVKPWTLALAVSEADTGQPLPGVTVTVGDRSATSDASGAAQLQPYRGMTVTVSLDGFAPVELLYEGQESLAVALTRARLEGHLRNKATGAPLKGVPVLVYRQGVEVPEVLRADDEGYFAVEDADGVNRLLIKATGHRRHEIAIAAAGALEVELAPFEARAIYIPFMLLALPDRIGELVGLVEDSEELNAIVVDVKGDRAWLAWESQVPLAQEIDAYYHGLMDLREFLTLCHDRDIYVIARMVMFKDEVLAAAHPEWAATYADGRTYVDLEGLRWVDPFRREVRDYNLDLAREVALMGFDEVQLDYVRFPSDGSTRGLTFSEESTFESRTRAMAEFSAEMSAVIAPTPAFFSADIFGLVVWVDPGRDMGIGQRLDDIAPHMDYISPMLYPTTFGPGNLGYQNPGLYPYEVVYRSVRKTQERTDTLVRPWLQHYSIGGIEYGMLELLKQKKAAEDRHSSGWIYWNSRGKYERDLFMKGTQELYADQLPSAEEFEAQEDAARAAE